MLMAMQKFATSTISTMSAVRQTMDIFVVMYHSQPQKRFTSPQHHLTARQQSFSAQQMAVFRHQMPPPALTRVAKERNGASATSPAT